MLVATSLLALACGDALSPVTLSEDDAAEVYVEATLQPYLLAVHLFGTQSEITVDKSTTCSVAGSFAVTGTESPTALDLSAAFSGCKIRRYTMDGTITISGTTGATSASVNWHGTLVLSGTTQGECWVDVLVTIAPAAQTLTGTVCGADAAKLPDAAKKAGLVG